MQTARRATQKYSIDITVTTRKTLLTAAKQRLPKTNNIIINKKEKE